VSYSMRPKYVHRRRGQILLEDRACAGGAGGVRSAGHGAGRETEADFGGVAVRLAGEPARCLMFAFRLSCSGKTCHQVYASQAQEAFLEGHVTAFEAIRGYLPGRFAATTFPRRPPGVGLGYTMGAVTCAFSYQREVVMRRSGTRGLVRRGLVSGGSGARRG
jgi:hypothetical protein